MFPAFNAVVARRHACQGRLDTSIGHGPPESRSLRRVSNHHEPSATQCIDSRLTNPVPGERTPRPVIPPFAKADNLVLGVSNVRGVSL
jgi:hypothetical protein